LPDTDPQSDGASFEDQLVTVVIPARNEEEFIGQCLASVVGQTHARLQIIVVDGASEDRTAALVEEWARRDSRIELLHNPEALIPVSLNLALGAARGRWFVRVDAHATVPSEYVASAVEHLATGSWGGVGGRKDGVGRTPAGRAVAAAMASRFGVGNSAYHYAEEPRTVEHVPFGAYPVELVRELGGWDDRLAVNQDFEFDHRVRRAGYELLLDPAMVIDWHCRQTIGGLFRQYYRYGRGKVAVARLHPDSVRLRHLAAPVLVGSWVVAIVAFLLGHRRAPAVMVGPYVAALLAASTSTALKVRDWQASARLPLAFLAMHSGWGLGFWRGLIAALRGVPTHGAARTPVPEPTWADKVD
jgi:succinoglycan biosynthesis protein ExoA